MKHTKEYKNMVCFLKKWNTKKLSLRKFWLKDAYLTLEKCEGSQESTFEQNENGNKETKPPKKKPK